MPKISATVTRYETAYSINVRVRSGCPLWDDEHEMCCHPALVEASITKNMRRECALEHGHRCPLELCPVMLTRTPDHVYDAVQGAVEKRARRS